MPSLEQAGAILEIDLGALAANYRLLRARLQGAECAAVVKAGGYGLGAERTAPALAAAGCGHFFVAHLAEGIELRRVLPQAAIYVLHGPPPETEAEFRAHHLIPVLNTPDQIEAWAIHGRTAGGLPALLQIDTGMSRLGLSPAEVEALAAAPERLQGIDLRYLVSHLACAEEADNLMNARQRHAFVAARGKLPPAPASLANSSAIFLGPEYHFDLARPGVALYGVNPTPDAANPMAEVVRLKGKITQLREIDTPQTVGYGATYRAPGRRCIATVPVGYADGFPRALSGRGRGSIAGVSVPIVGRVSMDLITLDVTEAPDGAARVGALVDLIGGGVPIDEVAASAGTIGYEILTNLGGRYHRRYLGGGDLP